MSDLPHTQDLPSASQSNPCTDDREPISEVSSNSETSASTSECDSLSNALHSDDDDDDGTDTTITTPTTHEPDTQESKILLHRPTPAQNSVSSNPAGKPSYSDRITASKTASEGLHRRGRSAQITHPEDGWDADSPTKGLVLQHGTKDGLPTVERRTSSPYCIFVNSCHWLYLRTALHVSRDECCCPTRTIWSMDVYQNIHRRQLHGGGQTPYPRRRQQTNQEC